MVQGVEVDEAWGVKREALFQRSPAAHGSRPAVLLNIAALGDERFRAVVQVALSLDAGILERIGPPAKLA
jgi:hypothetical protein